MQDLHISVVQIQPRKHVLLIDHADCTAPTRQRELDHTDHTDHTDQGAMYPERSDHQAGIDHTDHLSWCEHFRPDFKRFFSFFFYDRLYIYTWSIIYHAYHTALSGNMRFWY